MSPGYSPVLENYTRFSDPVGSSASSVVVNDPAPVINKSNIPSASSSTSTSSPKTSSKTPPMSPSFLRVGSNTTNDYFRQTNSDDYIFTTRSSSLNRATSSSSGKSIVHVNQNTQQRIIPPSPNNKYIFSNPTSPLAFEIKTPALLERQEEIPNHAFVSYIIDQFINAVTLLNERRRIYCSAEYPMSFTGEEAFVSVCMHHLFIYSLDPRY